MKEEVLYVGLQKGDSELGIPDLQLVEGEEGTSKVFDTQKQVIVGLTETAKSRGITIPKEFLLLLVALFVLMSPIVMYADEPDCFYPWHDHYKTNYRKRHKHKVCGSVESHYRLDEPLRTMQLYYPGVYLGEVPENEEDRITIKNLRKLLQETAE